MKPGLVKGARIREESFGGILMAPIESALKTGQVFYLLDEVSFLILSNCNGQNNLENIANIVVLDFDVDLDQAKADIESYIIQLIKAGIIEEMR